MNDNKPIEDFPEDPDIEINDNETFIKYLDELKESLPLTADELKLIDKLVEIIDVTKDSDVATENFNLGHMIEFIDLMEKYPSKIEIITACAHYITSWFDLYSELNLETLEACFDSYAKLTELTPLYAKTLAADEIAEINALLELTKQASERK